MCQYIFNQQCTSSVDSILFLLYESNTRGWQTQNKFQCLRICILKFEREHDANSPFPAILLALNTDIRTCQLHKNATFSHSDTHHTNSQQINSTLPRDPQLKFIWLALHAASPGTFCSKLVSVVRKSSSQIWPVTSRLSVGRNSVVGIATRYVWTVRGLNPGGGRDFSQPSRLALGPTQPVSFPGVKRPRRGVDHTPHLVPGLKKE